MTLNRAERRMPIKVVTLKFDEDGYPGFTSKGRTNIPVRLSDDFQSGDEERGRAAMLVIFPEWDFVDEEGEPIPHTADGIGLMPQDLLGAMFIRWAEVMRKAAGVPKASGDGSKPTTPTEPAALTEAGSLSGTPE